MLRRASVFPYPVLLVLALIVAAATASAAPRAEPWERWTAHAPTSTARIDHADWNGFLKKYVRPGADGINRLPYGAVSKADKASLKAYIRRLGKTSVGRYNRAEQFAFWVNLYNAATVNLMLDSYPVRSIRDIDISPGLLADGPWGRKLVSVEGEPLSLDDIEHRILRPVWRDPRIHYVVSCAAVGCPNLAPRALTAANKEALLDRAARDYINHPRGVNKRGSRLYLSKIYKWYRDDFGGGEAGVIDHLSRYARPALAARIRDAKGIGGYVYDWALNDFPAPDQSSCNTSDLR